MNTEGTGENNTVYGELKLSEKINTELQMSKEIILNLQEELQ
jgi:hypothetical protein